MINNLLKECFNNTVNTLINDKESVLIAKNNHVASFTIWALPKIRDLVLNDLENSYEYQQDEIECFLSGLYIDNIFSHKVKFFYAIAKMTYIKINKNYDWTNTTFSVLCVFGFLVFKTKTQGWQWLLLSFLCKGNLLPCLNFHNDMYSILLFVICYCYLYSF